MSQSNKHAVDSLRYGEKIALAAGSLSALALLPAGAEAGVVYFNTSITSPATNGSVAWDVDGGNGDDFKLGMRAGHVAMLNSYGLNGRGLVLKAVDTSSQFENLPVNFIVGPSLAAGYAIGATNLVGHPSSLSITRLKPPASAGQL